VDEPTLTRELSPETRALVDLLVERFGLGACDRARVELEIVHGRCEFLWRHERVPATSLDAPRVTSG